MLYGAYSTKPHPRGFTVYLHKILCKFCKRPMDATRDRMIWKCPTCPHQVTLHAK